MRTPSRRARCMVVALLACAVALTAAPANAAAAGIDPPRVMVRNLYLGADLTPAVQAATTGNPALILPANAGVYNGVVATNFAARAKVLANEVATHRPYLIGLQEVATWSFGALGVFDGPATPATSVQQDFLALLQAELAARGLSYAKVSEQAEMDIEGPAGAPYFRDIRLQMRDVILARTDLPSRLFSTGNPQSANYSAANSLVFPIPDPNPDIVVRRGWTSIDVKVLGRPALRFVNTHLEAFHPGIRAQQAGELAAHPVLATTRPVILVGDLNSDPAAAFPNNAAYGVFVPTAGFHDTGNTANTCCHADDLLDAPNPGVFTSRIDHILTRPNSFGLLNTQVIGNDAANRTPGGLWPSDHGGVVAGL